MSEALFEKIVAELSEYTDWIEMVCLSRAGEPLLDKKIGHHIHRLKEAGIRKVWMTTNASLLTEKKAVELLEAGLDDIMLSIDSVDKDNYEKMRVGLKYEKVMHNIETFFKVRDEINPKMVVRVRGVSYYDTEKAEDLSELKRWEAFWDRFRKPHDRIYMKRLHSWGNQIDVTQRTGGIADGEYGDVFHPCIVPWSTMHITAMGIVALCPMDYDAKLNLGDINRESIADVWRNKKWAWVRKLHGTGNRNAIQLCQGCKIFDLDFSLENKREQPELG
jgi:MoaA/NifB/PqqE/SkfB family radical SAM enzyme